MGCFLLLLFFLPRTITRFRVTHPTTPPLTPSTHTRTYTHTTRHMRQNIWTASNMQTNTLAGWWGGGGTHIHRIKCPNQNAEAQWQHGFLRDSETINWTWTFYICTDTAQMWHPIIKIHTFFSQSDTSGSTTCHCGSFTSYLEKHIIFEVPLPPLDYVSHRINVLNYLLPFYVIIHIFVKIFCALQTELNVLSVTVWIKISKFTSAFRQSSFFAEFSRHKRPFRSQVTSFLGKEKDFTGFFFRMSGCLLACACVMHEISSGSAASMEHRST